MILLPNRKIAVSKEFPRYSSVIHTHFREDVPEIKMDKSKFSICSPFMTFVDVYDLDIELEFK